MIFIGALSFRLNWDGIFRTLEAQAESALENQRVMGRSIEEVLGKLGADRDIQQQLSKAYGHAPGRAGLGLRRARPGPLRVGASIWRARACAPADYLRKASGAVRDTYS